MTDSRISDTQDSDPSAAAQPIRKRADLLRGLAVSLPAEVYVDVERTINAWHERRKDVERERDILIQQRDQARLIVRGMWGAQTPTSETVDIWNRAIALCQEWQLGTLDLSEFGKALRGEGVNA